MRTSEEAAKEIRDPPQPAFPLMNLVEFDSIEEMRENLLLDGRKPSDKQLQDIIWELGPGKERFQLRKSSDDKHLWHATKVLKMEAIGLTIRLLGQHHIDAQQEYQARLTANTTDYRSPEELASPLRERSLPGSRLRREKEVAPKKGTHKGERPDPKSSGVKGEGYEHPSSAGEPRGDSPAEGGRPEPDSGTTAGSARDRSSATSAARSPHAQAKPCPQQPPLVDSGSVRKAFGY